MRRASIFFLREFQHKEMFEGIVSFLESKVYNSLKMIVQSVTEKGAHPKFAPIP
jgi:hypothetical protein